MLALGASQVALQARNGSSGALRDAVQATKFRCIEISPINRVLQMVLGFGERAACYVEKSRKVRVGSSSEAFRNITRCRRRGVPDLIVEPKIPFDLGMIR